MYHGCTTYELHPDPQLNQQELYSALAEELIDNNIRLSMNQRIQLAINERPNNAPIAHDNINPVPEIRETNSRKRGRYRTMTKYCK